MATIDTRDKLAQYCLRKLGQPVVKVNVAPEQVEDRLDDALQVYSEKHFDASEEDWVGYTVTQADVDNGYITMPNDILAIIDVMPANSLFASSDMFSYQYQMATNQLSPWQPFSQIDYFMQMTNYQSIADMTSADRSFEYVRHGSKLKLPGGMEVGLVLGLNVQRVIDGTDAPSIWNDKWLKEYSTALIKRQWGENTKKFGGIQLLGGVTINGDQLFSEAIEEIQRLEETLTDTYQLPTDFIFG